MYTYHKLYDRAFINLYMLIALGHSSGGYYVGSKYLSIIPRARMSYWLRGHEGERNNWFSKIQLVGQKYREKPT